jgi:hypothetical protein
MYFIVPSPVKIWEKWVLACLIVSISGYNFQCGHIFYERDGGGKVAYDPAERYI